MIQVDSIVIPELFVDLCDAWHDGINCMLYAVASTGSLINGTTRPDGCDSEEKWYLTIWRELSCDVDYITRQAGLPDCDEHGDLPVLLEFVEWVDSQVSLLEESYGLADWDACDG